MASSGLAYFFLGKRVESDCAIEVFVLFVHDDEPVTRKPQVAALTSNGNNRVDRVERSLHMVGMRLSEYMET